MTRYILLIALLSGSIHNIGKADNKYYECLSKQTHDAPHNQVYYTIEGQTKDKNMILLQQGYAKDKDAAEKIRKELAQQYGINDSSCMPLFHE